MRYADPQACPSCRGPIGGTSRCSQCGFDLTSAQAHELWRLFTEADRLVHQGQQARPVGDPLVAQTPSSPAVAPAVLADPVAAPGRPLSVGAVLLGLGALSLVVAALIFVSIAWGSLGIVGRATILAVITALWGVALAAALRRGLSATSEALTFIVLAMLSVNVFAARIENFLGLASVPWGFIALLWTGVLAAVGLLVVRASRVRLRRTMVMAEVVVAASAWISAPMVAVWIDGQLASETFWALVLGGLVLAGTLGLMIRTHQKLGTWIAGVGSICWVLLLSGWALVGYWGSDGIWDWPTVLPILSLAAASVVVGFAWRRGRTAAFAYTTLALATVATGTLTRVVEHFATESGALTIAAGDTALTIARSLVLLVLVGLASVPGIWRTAARWSTGAFALILLVGWSGWAAINFARIDKAMSGMNHFMSSDAQTWEVSAILISSVALVVLMLVVPTWRIRNVPQRLTPWFHLAAALFVVGGVATALVYANAPFLTHSLVVATGVPAVGFFMRREGPGWQLLALVPAVLAVWAVPGGSLDSFVTQLVVAAFLAGVVALRVSRDDGGWAPGILAAGSTVLLVCALPQLLAAADRPDWWSAVTVAAISAALLLVAMGLDEWRWIRGGVEAALGLVVLGAMLDVVNDPIHLALVSTIAGVACLVVALLQPGRRWQFAVATFFFGVAWVARLVAWDVDAIEAYSAPFAALALMVGVIAMLRRNDLGSWRALGAGLSLAFLPSLPFVLDEPVSLRAALWGALALVAMAGGIVRRWQSPFVIGSIALAIVIVANIGPVVMGLHRWILFGGVGLLLLGLGVTWEQRVQEGKSLIARVTRLR